MDTVASENITEAIVYFSTGKDSIVTLDLCSKYLKNYIVIYMYYNDLKYRNDFIKYYEDRYSHEIIKLPHPELAKYYKNRIFGCEYKDLPIMSLNQYDNSIRSRYNISYIAYGYKKTDSLARRGIIWQGNGIDKRNKKIYPVADFSNKMILKYIKDHKLRLSPEYQSGFRDINNFFEKNTLRWLKINFYDNYLLLKDQFPLIDSVFNKE